MTMILKRFQIPSFLAVLLCSFLSVAAVSAAPLEGPGQLYTSVPVPSGVTLEQVKDAVVATLAGRQWEVQKTTDKEVVGYLKHRSNEALVTLTFDTTKVDISCVGYKINKRSGERLEPEMPKGWLNNIQKDLSKRLTRASVSK